MGFAPIYPLVVCDMRLDAAKSETPHLWGKLYLLINNYKVRLRVSIYTSPYDYEGGIQSPLPQLT